MNHARAFTEACPEYSVGILEHAILQTDDNELRTLEPCLDETANILRMGKIQSSVNFVENIHRRRLELKKCHNEREGNKRSVIRSVSMYLSKNFLVFHALNSIPLATAQLC